MDQKYITENKGQKREGEVFLMKDLLSLKPLRYCTCAVSVGVSCFLAKYKSKYQYDCQLVLVKLYNRKNE